MHLRLMHPSGKRVVRTGSSWSSEHLVLGTTLNLARRRLQPAHRPDGEVQEGMYISYSPR